jgi:hypothetical protein
VSVLSFHGPFSLFELVGNWPKLLMATMAINAAAATPKIFFLVNMVVPLSGFWGLVHDA